MINKKNGFASYLPIVRLFLTVHFIFILYVVTLTSAHNVYIWYCQFQKFNIYFIFSYATLSFLLLFRVRVCNISLMGFKKKEGERLFNYLFFCELKKKLSYFYKSCLFASLLVFLLIMIFIVTTNSYCIFCLLSVIYFFHSFFHSQFF